MYQHLKDEAALFDSEGHWRADLDLEELDVPHGVRAVIGRRVDGVSEASQRVLTLGAVIGRAFSLELLEAIGDVTGEALLTALEDAEAHFLIVAVSKREARWEFSHGLIRQTLAERLSVPRLQRAHLRVADALEQAAASPEAQAASIAHHLMHAGRLADSQKAVRYLTLAGDLAQEAGAFDEALRQFNAALSTEDQDDARQVADLRYKKGRALRSLFRWEETIEEWKQVLSLLEDLGDHAVMATVCCEMAYLLIWSARGREAAAFVRRVLEVGGPGASGARCRLLANGAWGLGQAAEDCEDVTAGDEMLSQSVAIAETLGDPHVQREALVASAFKHFTALRRPEQAETALRAIELLRSAGDVWNMADAIGLFQLASVHLGRLDGVARFEEEAEPLVERLGNVGAEVFLRWAQAQRDWMTTADLDQLEVHAERLVSLGTPFVSMLETWRVFGPLWRGDWAEARDRAQTAASREAPGMGVGFCWSVFFLCECFLGHKETALVGLEERRGGLPSPGRSNTAGAWSMLLGVVEGLAIVGEREAAAELYPLVLDAVGTGLVVSWTPHTLLQTVAGIAAASGSRWEEAETHHRMALRQAHDMPFRSQQPEVRRWYAQMLLDRNGPGDRDTARTLLGEAVETYRAIGMPRHLALAGGMLESI